METKSFLENIILKKAKKRDSSSHEKKIGEYHMSKLYSCSRRQYFEFTVPKENSDEKTLIFEMGHIIHEYIERCLSDSRILETEGFVSIELDKDITIVGTYDILGEDDKGKFLVDIKTTARHPEVARPHNVEQLMLYMGAKNIKRGFLLSVEKNTLSTRVFEIVFDKLVFDELLDKARRLHKYLVNKKVPDPDNINWECKYCGYVDECKQVSSE